MTADLVSEFLLLVQEQDLDHQEAAMWFLNEHPDVWTKWVPDDVEERVRAALQ